MKNLIITGEVTRGLWYSVAIPMILHRSFEISKASLLEKIRQQRTLQFDNRGSEGF